MASINDIGEHSSSTTQEEERDQLVFPINIHESLQSASGIKKGEKVGLIISFWIFGCAILTWFLAGWLRMLVPSYYIWIVILVQVVLQLTVGVYVLRYAMDERAIFSEMNANSETFATYFRIYKEIKANDGSKYPFDVLEFDDGSYGVFIQCRLGHNTQLRSNNTYIANKQVTQILSKSGFPWKTYYHNEHFRSSQAAQDMRDVLSHITDPELFTAYREIVQNYLNIAEDESNVLCATHLIYAPTRVSKDELAEVIMQIVDVLCRDDTVYREVECLQYEEIVEFLRNYYRLEVLDMGMIRAHIAAKRNAFNCPVTVLKLYGQSGKIYAREEFHSLNSEILAQSGLDRAN